MQAAFPILTLPGVTLASPPWVQLLHPISFNALKSAPRTTSQFIGVVLSPYMAATVRPRLPLSFMRSILENGSAGIPMLPKKRSTFSPGTGELHMEDGSTHRVGPGSVFAILTPVKHDLVNVGKETLRAVAFFAAVMFIQTFDNVMMPPKSHILGTPNREG